MNIWSTFDHCLTRIRGEYFAQFFSECFDTKPPIDCVVTNSDSSRSNDVKIDDTDVMEVVESEKKTSDVAATPPKDTFKDEYDKVLGSAKSTHNVDTTDEDVQILSDGDDDDTGVGDDEDNDVDGTHRKTTLTPTKQCSVKLVDINELVDNGEPLAKRPRPSDPLAIGRKSSNEANNVFTSKLSENKKDFTKSGKDEINNFFSSGVDGALKLFSAKKESKVTISPVRNKDLPNLNSSSAGGLSTNSNTATGSVTITKLSTGSSLSIESKDLKTILGATKTSIGAEKDKMKQEKISGKSFDNGFRIGSSHAKLDLVAIDSKLSKSTMSSSLPPGHRRVRTGSGDSSIRCNKCREVYSTKEARRLHTCNSILDQHFLIEGENRLKISPTSSKDSSDNSRSSSRADSPLSSLSPTLPCSTPTTLSSTTTLSSASSTGFGTVKKIKITTSEVSLKTGSISSTSMTTSSVSLPVKCKLIKDSKDELHIEGRPKLSIVKVSRLECGSSAANLDRKNSPMTSSVNQQPIVPKLKLSALPVSSDSKRDREKWIGGVTKDPLSLGDTYKSLKVTSEASKKLNFDEKSVSLGAVETSDTGDKSNGRKIELVSSNFGSGKIRIKYGGVLPTVDDPLKAEVSGEKDHNPMTTTDDGFPFTFSGRPTYSPSRVEPNGNVPTKGTA